MNYHQMLQSIVYYYDSTRGVGHTKQMIEGLQPDALVLVESVRHARNLGLDKTNYITIENLRMGSAFHGERGPLAIDHHTLQLLITGAAKEYSDVESKLRNYQIKQKAKDDKNRTPDGVIRFKASNTQIGKVCAAAVNASTPMGLGMLHYDEKRRYSYNEFAPTDKDSKWIDLDYVDGRMVKLHIMYEGKNIWHMSSILKPAYQSWCKTYPTVPHLLEAAGVKNYGF